MLIATAVNEEGYREVIGAEDGVCSLPSCWIGFFQMLKMRGLDGVELIISDNYPGIMEAAGKVFPEARFQQCVDRFYQNVLSLLKPSKRKSVAKMLKAIHAQDSKGAALDEVREVVAALDNMKLTKAAWLVESGADISLTYYDFPGEHWPRIRSSNAIGRLERDIRERTSTADAFVAGESSSMRVFTRLRRIAGSRWGQRRYVSMSH